MNDTENQTYQFSTAAYERGEIGFNELKKELRSYLDQTLITSENIGDIRRFLFFPWDSAWNGVVRDETAARENKPALNDCLKCKSRPALNPIAGLFDKCLVSSPRLATA